MITIEEKLKLFTKIVYGKVDKENEKVVENFNKEFGTILEQKKQEFTNEANAMAKQSEKDIEKKKLHILSKARTEEKKIIMEKRKQIYDETVKDLIKYAEGFTETEEYKENFFKDFKSAVSEISDCSSLDICLTQRDIPRFKDEILSILKGKTVQLNADDEIAGGFIILDNERNIKLDMSFLSRIQNSRDLIGRKLFEAVQCN